jgi:hypothetical protein
VLSRGCCVDGRCLRKSSRIPLDPIPNQIHGTGDSNPRHYYHIWISLDSTPLDVASRLEAYGDSNPTPYPGPLASPAYPHRPALQSTPPSLTTALLLSPPKLHLVSRSRGLSHVSLVLKVVAASRRGKPLALGAIDLGDHVCETSDRHQAKARLTPHCNPRAAPL